MRWFLQAWGKALKDGNFRTTHVVSEIWIVLDNAVEVSNCEDVTGFVLRQEEGRRWSAMEQVREEVSCNTQMEVSFSERNRGGARFTRLSSRVPAVARGIVVVAVASRGRASQRLRGARDVVLSAVAAKVAACGFGGSRRGPHRV